MTGLGWPDFVGAFLVALVLSWAVTPLMLRLALRWHAVDAPDTRKAQDSPVPYLGGVGIVLTFVLVVAVAALVNGPASTYGALAVVLGLGVLLALMGLVDDLRGLPTLLRLGLEVGAAVAVFETGYGASIGPPPVAALITVVWVVGVTNAFNLLDNMDGLSAGVAALAAGFFALIAGLNGQVLVAALSAALAGCALGFLRHNFHPAKIYMGDAGSLFLGYLLAVCGLLLRLTDRPPAVALLVPLVVLGVALFDTSLVTLDRLRHGRSPMTAGRDHTSHRLVWIGVPVPVAVGLVYGAAVALGWLALVLSRADLVAGLLLGAFVLTAGAVLLGLLAAVPVYDNSRRRQAMLQVVRVHEAEPVAAGASSPSSS